jgi:hypothetical protein
MSYGDDRLSGVELLALYGDDDRLGFNWKRGLGKAFAVTPQGALYNYGMKKTKSQRKKMFGDDERIGAFLPGLKKVGKVTSGFTGGIAKAFLPPQLVNAAAKLDPTRKGASAKAAVAVVNAPPKTPVPVKKNALNIDVKKVAIIGGAGVGALVLLKILLGSHK